MDKIVNILIVEDDQLDVIDIHRSLNKMGIYYQLHTAKNGEEAIKLLQEMGSDTPPKLPDFVLIDINMPRMNGIELLTVIRQTPEWKHLKCFIITTSDERSDHDVAKKLGVSGYITKPLKLSNPSSMDAFNLMIDLLNTKA
ncbi:response regulator [Polluticoccus soli]|uniref:response regulator n=1 Tax=Polluticoccus soli TaxID=3034150 RepID=UPI0023E2CC20|nr:response regulator [Flavipsychrobacter sp. JY13-12]